MRTKITIYHSSGREEVMATTQEKNKKELLDIYMNNQYVAKITTQNYPLSSNEIFVHYENPAVALHKKAPLAEPEPIPEPEPEITKAEPSFPTPPTGSTVFTPKLMSPVLYMGRNVLSQYERDFQGNITCLSKNLGLFGIGSALSSINFQINNVMNYVSEGDRGEGAHFVAIRRIAIDALLAILYLDGQTTLKRFKDEYSARAIVDYLDRNFTEGHDLAMRHVTMTFEKGGIHALIALLSIQTDQLSRVYLNLGSGKDLAYDARHYLNHPEAVLIRDRLIDFLETTLLVMYVIFNLRNQKKEA